LPWWSPSFFPFLRIEVHSNRKADRAAGWRGEVGFLDYRIERWDKAAGEGRAESYEDKTRYIFGSVVNEQMAGTAGDCKPT
jgi:hypothetical protein